MPLAIRAAVFVALLAGLLAPPAAAQPDDAKALQQKFQAEREAAVKAKFPADALSRPDDLAKRADAAVAANTQQLKTLVNLGKTDKPLKALAFKPDGKFLAVGGDDGILRVVEGDTGKATYTSPTRNARIEKVAYSPNGNMIALGDSNSQVA